MYPEPFLGQSSSWIQSRRPRSTVSVKGNGDTSSSPDWSLAQLKKKNISREKEFACNPPAGSTSGAQAGTSEQCGCQRERKPHPALSKMVSDGYR